MKEEPSTEQRNGAPSLTPNGWTVLGLVSFSDGLSGYQLKRWADFGPGFFYVSPSFSQVYSELKKLEELGLVASREADSDDNSRNKRLYSITPAGKRALTEWVRNSPADRPVLKHPVLMRVMLGHFNEHENLKAMLLEHIDRSELQSQQAAHYARFAASDPHFAYVWIALRWAERYYAAERMLTIELLKDIELAAERFVETSPPPEWFEAAPFPGKGGSSADPPPNTSRLP
ncbi:PadR family transcriptional regulator [Mycolicibacterium sp. CH28]|uniref:PadR family transcriptional regulator n=1 Tax=Mycolicibacterium sp. CH28 TaxID=2512237 RepID=UPI0010811212|nr:PadR family transcriptional regulator [Mycolicibacterium sp. CH28]TGD87904.1 PadR family transcriptional regulator [Mycolicibacterium sp. CH28]